jgi:hypothetical protein
LFVCFCLHSFVPRNSTQIKNPQPHTSNHTNHTHNTLKTTPNKQTQLAHRRPGRAQVRRPARRPRLAQAADVAHVLQHAAAARVCVARAHGRPAAAGHPQRRGLWARVERGAVAVGGRRAGAAFWLFSLFARARCHPGRVRSARACHVCVLCAGDDVCTYSGRLPVIYMYVRRGAARRPAPI